MSSQANPTLIGAFVLGAVGLAVAGLFVFSGMDLFATEVSYVAYFESAVTGLDVGAPVRFQGVRVGRVSAVQAVYDGESKDIMIPVTLTFEEGSVRLERDVMNSGKTTKEEALETIGLMIERGLKAELGMDSFVTGKLYVALNYYPDDLGRYVNEGMVKLPEMPTSQSQIDRLVRSIEQLPIEDLFNEANATIVAIKTLASNPRIDEILAKISAGLDEIGPLTSSTRDAMDEVRDLAANVNRNVDPAVDDLRTLIATLEQSVEAVSLSVTSAVAEAQQALEPLDRLLGRNYELPHRVGQLLSEMASATRAIRNLVDYLERHPEAVLRGKR